MFPKIRRSKITFFFIKDFLNMENQLFSGVFHEKKKKDFFKIVHDSEVFFIFIRGCVMF